MAPLAIILNGLLGQFVLSVPTALSSAKETHSWQRIEQEFRWAMDASWMFWTHCVQDQQWEEELLLDHVGSSDELTSAGRGKAAFLHQGCVQSLWSPGDPLRRLSVLLSPHGHCKRISVVVFTLQGYDYQSLRTFNQKIFLPHLSPVQQSLQIRIWSVLRSEASDLILFSLSLSFTGFPPPIHVLAF